MEWTLKPGETIKRTELHDKYGGRRQGGISPSAGSDNIMVFTSPAGEQYGYYDGQQSDGCFHYTGEGQEGDQDLKQGNKSLLEHVSNGNHVRLFNGARGDVDYVGEFEVDEDPPYYITDALDKKDVIRKIIIFRLKPKGDVESDLIPHAQEEFKPASSEDEISTIPTENKSVENFVTSAVTKRVAERREAKLVERYLSFRKGKGLPELQRLKIIPKNETQALYNDLYSPSENLLIEAKGSVTREAIRMAVGQLMDYARFVDKSYSLSVLLPEPPREDLRLFLNSLAINVICPDGEGHFA